MQRKRITIFILTAFIAGTLLLVYIEYNSSKNINNLITGNEKLMEEFKVNAELNELEKDVVSVESKIRGVVATGDTIHLEGVDKSIDEVETDLGQLQKISDDDNSVLYIDELDTLVKQKLLFSRQILDTLNHAGKAAAEKLIATQYGKKLTDSIIATAHKIDSTRKRHLADATVSIDRSGKKAQQFSLTLIVLVLVGGAILFWYIINTIRRQISLIRQLNISEKMVKETARIKENFMANMSHEIRTPMNAILGFTNLLQRKNLDGESREFVETIQRSGENLLTIINDVLDLSKIEAGMMRIEATPFSIRGLLHSVEVMFKSKADEKGIQIHTDIDDTVPDTLEGDATRLTQILINLIGNALKFTKKGSISIKVSNEGKTDNSIRTGITISDTGIGIDKDKQEHIFNRFQQADNTVTRNYGGTGLGLSIVKDLVLLQNGTIAIESEPGMGTAFILMIQYKIAEGQFNYTFSGDAALNLIHDFIDVRILVVEDNEINQSLIKHLFKSWGLEYDLVNNGREAIDKLQKEKYSLILMDIQMPEMDGYTATQEIRETLELTTPIIAMTAHVLAGEKEKCLSYGMNDYISKPIREAQLHKLITQFTHIPISDVLQRGSVIVADWYKYINLQYMKEISSGNMEYEKTVTEQFIEAIPEDLLAIEKAWRDKHISDLRQLAHNMKTTISVMGLNESLQPYLDAIEYEDHNEESFSKNFQSVKLICTNALQEAKLFFDTL
ncbi:MAG: response regulator [Rhizobacter sp.]|nr:response regulator [Ferruginibacter sp.]